jgi:hypothetical protein
MGVDVLSDLLILGLFDTGVLNSIGYIRVCQPLKHDRTMKYNSFSHGAPNHAFLVAYMYMCNVSV